MNSKGLRYLRAGAGAIVLLTLVLLVRGWWGEYQLAAERQSAPETTATASAEASASPDSAKGEGSTEKPAAPVKAVGTVTVLIDGLNFREKPEADAKPIRGLRKGEKLTVLTERAGWYEVRSADGSKGWVSSNPNYTELEK